MSSQLYLATGEPVVLGRRGRVRLEIHGALLEEVLARIRVPEAGTRCIDLEREVGLAPVVPMKEGVCWWQQRVGSISWSRFAALHPVATRWVTVTLRYQPGRVVLAAAHLGEPTPPDPHPGAPPEAWDFWQQHAFCAGSVPVEPSRIDSCPWPRRPR